VGTCSVGNNVFGSSIRSAAFFNYALSESDLKNLRQKGANLHDREQALVADPVPQEIDRVQAIPDNVTVSADMDAPNGTPGWFKLERVAGSGTLELSATPTRKLAKPSDGYRIVLDLYNPNSEILYASAACGMISGSPHGIPPFSERSISGRGQQNQACDDLRIALTDAEGRVRKDLQAGQSIYIKNLKLEPLGMIVNLDFIRKPWLR
jgi:hypothetical protein